MRYCHNCGKELADTNMYCVYCGTKLNVNVKRIQNKLGLIVILCVLMISLIAAGGLLLPKYFIKPGGVLCMSSCAISSDFLGIYSCYDLQMKTYNDSVTEATQSSEFLSKLTKEQAYDAVVNYCFATSEGLKSLNEEDYVYYWDIDDLHGEEYVVTYRSYTGAIIYFHVNINTGDVYTMEYVPMISTELMQGNDSFNAYDYINN